MTIKLSSSDLKRAVGILSRVIPTKAIISITECIRFACADGKAILSGTDLNNTIVLTVPCTGDDGTFCFELAELKALIQSDGEYTFTVKERSLKVKTPLGVSSYTIPDCIDFPATPKVTGELQDCPIEQMAIAADFCGGPNDARDWIKGAYIDGVNVAGTDALCLFVHPHIGSIKAILPSNLIKIANGIFSSPQMACNDTQILFSEDGLQLYGRLIDQNYGPYQNIIPTYELGSAANVSELIRTIRYVLSGASSKTNQVKMSFADGKLTVSANDIDYGKDCIAEPISVSGNIPDFDVNMNGENTIRVLSHINTETVMIKSNGNATQCIVYIPSGTEQLFLQIPLMSLPKN